MKKFKTAIIGVGKGGEGKAGIHSIGYAHAEAYQNNVRTELVGACDLNAENLQAFATTYAIPAAHTSLNEMLDAARPDIVSICTYASSHRTLVEQCLAAGVNAIWCEKPLCLAMHDGRAMLRAAEKAGASTYTLHHLADDEKRILFAKVLASLVPGGCAVFGDLMVKNKEEKALKIQQCLANGDTKTAEDLREEFFWSIDAAVVALCEPGFRVETRRFSDLSWGIVAERVN